MFSLFQLCRETVPARTLDCCGRSDGQAGHQKGAGQTTQAEGGHPLLLRRWLSKAPVLYYPPGMGVREPLCTAPESSTEDSHLPPAQMS